MNRLENEESRLGEQGRRHTLYMAAKYEHKGGELQTSAQGSRRVGILYIIGDTNHFISRK